MTAPVEFSVAALVATLILATPAVQADTLEPADVRVGVVAFEDFDAEFSRWQTVFSELSRNHQPPLRFRIALGTYGDVLHWMECESLDVAILTPGVFAESLKDAGQSDQVAGFRYMASVGLPAATSKWARADRRRAGYHYRCRSVCVVSAESPLRTLDELQHAAKQDRVRFLFVHPLSVSGRIAPELALRGLEVEPSREQVEFTHSHTGSLRLVTQAVVGKQRVAFVWDDALRGAPELVDSVRRLEFPQLESLETPPDVVVAREGFQHFDSLQSLLIAHVDAAGNPDFATIQDWARRYDVVRQWSRTLGLSRLSREAQAVSLDEIGQILLHNARSQPKPPRLALVLSGGGAKCSYQVGAVAALEEKLAELRQQDPDSGLDIELVVGTSGGAINALPVALGVSSTEAGRADFQRVWKQLDQRRIVRPAAVVRANIGLWFALFQAGCLLWLVRRFVRRPQRRGWVTCPALVVLAALQITAGYLEWSPWRCLGRNHTWHHAWLWCTFGIRTSAWCLLAAGLVGLLFQWILVRRGKFLTVPARPLTWTLVVCLLGLPIVQLVTVFFCQKTLSGGEGMEHALAEKFPPLMDRHLERHGKPPLRLDGASRDAQRLQAASRQVIQRRQLQRDLVITGNCLQQSKDTLPSDVYFYAVADPHSPPPPFGDRGISLHRWPSILLDVVLGSGSIFPVFPPRRLSDFPEPDEHVELIDGGFAHNSPMEAAVLWGATHIVLIEATPAKRRPRRNFAENAAAAYAHLFKQTQLVDVRSKQQVVVFTLTPEPPHMCVLDFADNLVEASIARGYHDARAGTRYNDKTITRLPRFQKELGEPAFTDVAIGRHQ